MSSSCSTLDGNVLRSRPPLHSHLHSPAEYLLVVVGSCYWHASCADVQVASESCRQLFWRKPRASLQPLLMAYVGHHLSPAQASQSYWAFSQPIGRTHGCSLSPSTPIMCHTILVTCNVSPRSFLASFFHALAPSTQRKAFGPMVATAGSLISSYTSGPPPPGPLAVNLFGSWWQTTADVALSVMPRMRPRCSQRFAPTAFPMTLVESISASPCDFSFTQGSATSCNQIGVQL